MSKKPVRLTDLEYETKKAYAATKAKSLGTLHERMKFVIDCLEKACPRLSSQPIEIIELKVSIYDLETEVECYLPADPPFAHRIIRSVFEPRRQGAKEGK